MGLGSNKFKPNEPAESEFAPDAAAEPTGLPLPLEARWVIFFAPELELELELELEAAAPDPLPLKSTLAVGFLLAAGCSATNDDIDKSEGLLSDSARLAGD